MVKSSQSDLTITFEQIIYLTWNFEQVCILITEYEKSRNLPIFPEFTDLYDVRTFRHFRMCKIGVAVKN